MQNISTTLACRRSRISMKFLSLAHSNKRVHFQTITRNAIVKVANSQMTKVILNCVPNNNELTILLRKGVIQKAWASPDQFISNIFLRKKPNSPYRVILNLKHDNDFVAHIHFKMDTLKDSILLIKRGCFFTYIDPQDTFYRIPLSPPAYKYFRFIHRDQLYNFTS